MSKNTINNILCIGAMSDEIVPLVKKLAPYYSERIHKGKPIRIQYKGKYISFLITGVGRKKVNESLATIEQLVSTIDNVILVGVCGAMDETFHIGDIVIPDTVVSPSHNEIRLSDINTLSGINVEGNYTIQRGVKLLTTDNFLSHTEKQRIKKTHPDIGAIDMESYYSVSFFQQKGIRVCVIKSVSDSLQCTLPHEEFLIQHYRTKSWGKRVHNAFFHPCETFRSYMLQMHTAYAIKRNVRFVKSFIGCVL